MPEFTSLEHVAGYLKMCRARKLVSGDWSFEAHGMEDRSNEVHSFFRNNPQHQVSINGAQRFLTFSDRALERLNRQLPAQAQLSPERPVMMANKFI